MALVVLLFSYPTWEAFIWSARPTRFGVNDNIVVVVKNAEFDYIHAVLDINPKAQESGGQEAGASIQTGAELSLMAYAFSQERETPTTGQAAKLADEPLLYIAFYGSAASSVAPSCAWPKGTSKFELKDAENGLIHTFNGFGGDPSIVFRVPYSGEQSGPRCRISDSVSWTRIREKSYFSVPNISIVTWQPDRRLRDREKLREVSDSPTAETCLSAVYSSNSYERLDTVDTSTSAKFEPEGRRVWANCKAELSASSDAYGFWVQTTRLGLSSLIVVDENAETENERKLFLSGITLGLVTALLVEALAGALQLVSWPRRWTKRAASKSNVADSDGVLHVVPKQREVLPGELWETWKRRRNQSL